MTHKDLPYYLNLPWSYRFEWSDIDECYLGTIVEIEENMTCGDTPEEVLVNLKEALESYLKTSLENDFPIPEPAKLADYKGVITYRTSPLKHYKLAKKAQTLGKSINAFIDETLDQAFI